MKEFLNLLIEELNIYNNQETRDYIDKVFDLYIE